MTAKINEALRLAWLELDRISIALDFMAEAHPHAGGQYMLVYLSNQVGAIADELRSIGDSPETESP